VSPPVKLSYQIHTVGGPINRIFSSVQLAMQWARKQWKDLLTEIGPYEEDRKATYGLFEDRGRGGPECFGTIAERRHCPTCGQVDAVRSDVEGPWSVNVPDKYVPKDLDNDD